MHGGKFISLFGRVSTQARKKKILLNNLISTDIATGPHWQNTYLSHTFCYRKDSEYRSTKLMCLEFCKY